MALIGLLVAAGVWQWNVAMNDVNEAGEQAVSIRNLVYAIQWWIFAAFGTWFWLRYIRDQRDSEIAELEQEVRNAPGEQIADETAAPAPMQISLDETAATRRDRARAIRDAEANEEGA